MANEKFHSAAFVITLAATLSFVGCQSNADDDIASACENICDWMDNCMMSLDLEICVADCVGDAGDSDRCQVAVQTLGDCVNPRGCAESHESCLDHADEYGLACR